MMTRRNWETVIGLVARLTEDGYLENRGWPPSPGRDRNERACKLLAEYLTPEQVATFNQWGYIQLRGSRNGTWRLTHNETLRRRPLGGWVAYCIGVNNTGGYYPWADDMLARLMAIKTNELLFRVRAVRLGRYR